MFALDPRTASSLISSSAEEPRIDRRVFLAASLGAFSAVLSGCGGKPAVPPKQPPPKKLPQIAVTSLDQLLPLPTLRWFVLARPKEIAAISWLEPSIALLLDKERLDRSAVSQGFDLRTLSEAAWASYRTEADAEDASVQLVRHEKDPLEIERLFHDRLSTDITRSIDDARVMRVSGRIGKTTHAFAAIGKDIVCLQQDGSMDRGPCRVASLLALGKLKRTRSVFEDPALHILGKRFESAPLRVFAPGPFEGDLVRGIRGLLAAATAIGLAFRPSTKESLLLEIAVTGDFSTSGVEAAQKLAASWDDLAGRPLGHLLGLDAPVAPAISSSAAEVVTLVVNLDPRKLAKGLADATSNQIRDIMR